MQYRRTKAVESAPSSSCSTSSSRIDASSFTALSEEWTVDSAVLGIVLGTTGVKLPEPPFLKLLEFDDTLPEKEFEKEFGSSSISSCMLPSAARRNCLIAACACLLTNLVRSPSPTLPPRLPPLMLPPGPWLLPSMPPPMLRAFRVELACSGDGLGSLVPPAICSASTAL